MASITSAYARIRLRATWRSSGPGRPTTSWGSRSSPWCADMRKWVVLACAFAALLTTSVAAQQPSVYAPLGGIPVLDTYLESLRQQAGIPGMSAAIVHDGTIIW